MSEPSERVKLAADRIYSVVEKYSQTGNLRESDIPDVAEEAWEMLGRLKESTLSVGTEKSLSAVAVYMALNELKLHKNIDSLCMCANTSTNQFRQLLRGR